MPLGTLGRSMGQDVKRLGAEVKERGGPDEHEFSARVLVHLGAVAPIGVLESLAVTFPVDVVTDRLDAGRRSLHVGVSL